MARVVIALLLLSLVASKALGQTDYEFATTDEVYMISGSGSGSGFGGTDQTRLDQEDDDAVPDDPTLAYNASEVNICHHYPEGK